MTLHSTPLFPASINGAYNIAADGQPEMTSDMQLCGFNGLLGSMIWRSIMSDIGFVLLFLPFHGFPK
jgi:hypothetical protein